MDLALSHVFFECGVFLMGEHCHGSRIALGESTLLRPRLDGYLTATLNLGDQTTPVAGDHGVEIVDRRVHVHGPHAIDVTVGRGEGLDALLEFTGQIQQPTAHHCCVAVHLRQAVAEALSVRPL
jgi:hypothetical protein